VRKCVKGIESRQTRTKDVERALSVPGMKEKAAMR
jgi:hypothetical protein